VQLLRQASPRLSHWDAALRDHKLVEPETWTEVWKPSKTRDGKANDYGFGLIPAGRQEPADQFRPQRQLGRLLHRLLPQRVRRLCRRGLSNGFNIDRIRSAIYQYVERHRKK
jgi:hypothetical protein